MFVATLNNNGFTFFLRGTIWTGDAGRAQLFADRVEAEFALEKARKFMKPAMFKKARIEQGQMVDNPAQTDNV